MEDTDEVITVKSLDNGDKTKNVDRWIHWVFDCDEDLQKAYHFCQA